MRSPDSILLLTLALSACLPELPKQVEGASVGDCVDGADNDEDGAFDCNDSDCAAAPDCSADTGVDTGADTGTGGDTGTTSENTAPNGLAVVITPAAPGPDDALNCTITTPAVDPDGDTVSYRYAWTVDGASAGVTAATVASTVTEAGQTWTCTVTPTDGTLDGASASVSVSIVQVEDPSPLGSTESNPGASCKAILDAGASDGDGTYWLRPDGTSTFQAYCDMRASGGGWTLIARGGNACASRTDYVRSLNERNSILGDSSGACGYLPVNVVTALAADATTVELRVGDSFGAWSSTSTSTNSGAIEALRLTTGNWHGSVTWSNWQWNTSCTSGGRSRGWPDMFHGCDFSGSVQWLNDYHGHARTHTLPDAQTSTWVR
jgi:hypothetical protein